MLCNLFLIGRYCERCFGLVSVVFPYSVETYNKAVPSRDRAVTETTLVSVALFRSPSVGCDFFNEETIVVSDSTQSALSRQTHGAVTQKA